ncbi:ABC transporter permease [Paracoccus pacificus]|uniref:ABC transporter permease n=1 Tax=Paracoccus pacificus TaxID=1463598 RepID=A0ABW4R6E8_9RHOB
MADIGTITQAPPADDRGGGVFLPRALRVLKLLGSVVVTLVGLAALTFMIGRLLPIDPVLAVLGDNATQEAYDKMAAKMGLDRPLLVQFADYLWSLLHFDLGVSLLSGRPVADEIARVFPATIELATMAMLIGTGIGVPLGVVAAVYRNSIIDHVARIVSLLGYSAPNFWLGLMGLVLFYATLGWVGGPGRIDMIYEFDLVPVTGFYLVDALLAGNWELFGNVFSHLILPASILALSAMAYISRMTRTFMIDQLEQEYVVAARAKGVGRWRIVWTHVFRNVAVQVITVVALSYAFLLEGAVLTETVFAWPGFGRFMTNSLLAGDMNSVVGCTLVIGVIFVVLNLICDILYNIIDPRTR